MFVVLELQTNENGSIGSLIYTYNSRAEAESKYHSVLSAAAISDVPVHTAVMMDNRGMNIFSQHYLHEDEEI